MNGVRRLNQDRLWYAVQHGYEPPALACFQRAGDLAANAAEIEHLMRERVREGKVAGRGFAAMHQDLLRQSEELADVGWHQAGAG